MKRDILKTMSSVLFNFVMGAIIASVLGMNAVMGAVVANMIAMAFGNFMPKNAACESVLKKVWTGKLIKSLRSLMDGS